VTWEPLARSFYDRATATVAQELLGRCLVRTDPVTGERRVGLIVETEAYLPEGDKACHAWKGRTARTEVMFGPPGHAYVYLIYGMHHCFNVVTEAEGRGSAVLVRALEPRLGWEGRTRGPGLLCAALGVDRRLSGQDVTQGGELFLADPPGGWTPPRMGKSARVGVDYAGVWARRLLRYFILGNPWVSPGKPSTGKPQ
jgi:DNA-3-methyladenine glycosylase